MKTNVKWIETDYWIETLLGLAIIGLTSLCLIALVVFPWFIYILLSVDAILIIILGVWQLLSGIINALNGDRLHKIYIAVSAVFFFVFYLCGVFNLELMIGLMLIIALVIAVWKYTVVRADYISLQIIDVPKTESDDLLDA
jgi:hypothetical protein